MKKMDLEDRLEELFDETGVELIAEYMADKGELPERDEFLEEFTNAITAKLIHGEAGVSTDLCTCPHCGGNHVVTVGFGTLRATRNPGSGELENLYVFRPARYFLFWDKVVHEPVILWFNKNNDTHLLWGEEAWDILNNDTYLWGVRCLECGAGTATRETPHEVRAIWNSRYEKIDRMLMPDVSDDFEAVAWRKRRAGKYNVSKENRDKNERN